MSRKSSPHCCEYWPRQTNPAGAQASIGRVPEVGIPFQCFTACPSAMPAQCERSRACRQSTERVTLNLGTEPNNGSDHRAGTNNLNFKKHAQVRLRVHHIVIPRSRHDHWCLPILLTLTPGYKFSPSQLEARSSYARSPINCARTSKSTSNFMGQPPGDLNISTVPSSKIK